MPPLPPSPPPRRWPWLLLLVALVTAADAAKPLRVDDACFHANAAQLAANPGDPYGFTAF